MAWLWEAARFTRERRWPSLEEKTTVPLGSGVRIVFSFVAGCVASYPKNKEVF
jgi:hypothetical protein